MMRRWHTPSLFAWFLLLLGLCVFLGLARWQWLRALEKEQLLAAFAAGAAMEPRPFAAVPDVLSPQDYPRVRVVGHYVANRGYWLDQQIQASRVGRHAIAVFQPAQGSNVLLVDLGWIAAPAGVAAPAWPPLPAGEIELHGLYAPPPGGGLRMGGNALVTQAAWPKVTVFLDPPAIAADLSTPIAPRLLLLDADSASGFVREWTPAIMPPAKHRGYALQWFSFAVAALTIFIVLHWRKDKKGNT